MDTRMGFPCPFHSVVIDSINLAYRTGQSVDLTVIGNLVFFSHMRLRTPTGSLVLDRSIRDGDLARGIHALQYESKQSDATLIVGIVSLRL